MFRISDSIHKSGPCPVLNVAEETTLAVFIQHCSKIGYPLGKFDVLMWVKKVLDKDGRTTPFNNNMPGNDIHWEATYFNV